MLSNLGNISLRKIRIAVGVAVEDAPDSLFLTQGINTGVKFELARWVRSQVVRWDYSPAKKVSNNATTFIWSYAMSKVNDLLNDVPGQWAFVNRFHY